MQGPIWLVFERNRALINIKLLSKFGEDHIVNGATIVFTSSIIAILIISWTIIQSCMGGSGWFAKGTELSWISNYCIRLIEMYRIHKQFFTDARTTDTTPRHNNGISKFCHFALFLMPPDCHFFSIKQYALNNLCRGLPKEHFY